MLFFLVLLNCEFELLLQYGLVFANLVATKVYLIAEIVGLSWWINLSVNDLAGHWRLTNYNLTFLVHYLNLLL
jgi:hypothetical protein